MTTITIERSLLEQALNALLLPCDRWNKQQFLIVKGAIESLNAALVAPAAAPEFPADWAQMIHYPECWDTAAYPELRDAIHEALAWSGCSVCKPATAPDEQVRRDAERVAWYENNPEKVLNIGLEQAKRDYLVAMQHSEYYAAQASYNDGLISRLSNYIKESTE